jgi:hypothetical protein
MHQVKIFKGLENEPIQMENRINEFLRETKAKVVQITGNIAPQGERPNAGQGVGVGGGLSDSFVPSDVLIVVLYEVDDGANRDDA